MTAGVSSKVDQDVDLEGVSGCRNQCAIIHSCNVQPLQTRPRVRREEYRESPVR